MTVNELLHSTRDTLQDQEKIFWDDSELLGYYEEARKVIASERLDKLQEQKIVLNAGDDLYQPEGVLRYVSAKDDEGTVRSLYPNDGSGASDSLGITIIDYNQIEVHDDSVGSTINMKYIGQPLEHNLNDSVRRGDEIACKYYILARAYEKETDAENFQKSDKFEYKFEKALNKLISNASQNYHNDKVMTIDSYQF